MKLWLLDADVIIDLLSFGIFDNLVERYEVYVATTVIGEIKSYKQGGKKHYIDFRKVYVENSKVKELSAISSEIAEILLKIPPIWRQTLNAGELESLAILKREEKFLICSCDAATIRALPFLDTSERGISVEGLINASGLKRVALQAKHSEKYFHDNLSIGKERWIQNFKS